MRKIIVGIDGCSKCKMLKEQCPDAEYIELDASVIVPLAQGLKFAEMPFAVLTGSVEELSKEAK